jgi:hypothetical protein
MACIKEAGRSLLKERKRKEREKKKKEKKRERKRKEKKGTYETWWNGSW